MPQKGTALALLGAGQQRVVLLRYTSPSPFGTCLAVSCWWRRRTSTPTPTLTLTLTLTLTVTLTLTPYPNPNSVVLVEKKSSGRLYALKLLEKSRMARQGALLICSSRGVGLS